MPKLDPGQRRVAEVDVVHRVRIGFSRLEPTVPEDHVTKFPGEPAARERGRLEVHTIEPRPLEDGVGEGRRRAENAAQIGSREVDVSVAVALSVQPGAEDGPAQVGALEVDPFEQCPPDAKIRQTHAFEPQVDEAAIEQPQPRQIRPGKIDMLQPCARASTTKSS